VTRTPGHQRLCGTGTVPGPDERLCDVLATDRQAMLGLGVRFEDLAAALSDVLAPALASPTHAAVINRPRVAVRIQQCQGFQICPWSPDPRHARPCRPDATGLELASMDWILEDLETRAELTGSGMAVHFLHDHHFCQGSARRSESIRWPLPARSGLVSSARSGPRRIVSRAGSGVPRPSFPGTPRDSSLPIIDSSTQSLVRVPRRDTTM
jgi:hypothetical protein